MATTFQMPDYKNSSYQTAPLQDYSHEFQGLARRLFQRVGEIVGSQQPKEYRGSYSVLASSSSASVAKIIIYETGKAELTATGPTSRMEFTRSYVRTTRLVTESGESSSRPAFRLNSNTSPANVP
jgi:hypothetical protein